MSDWVRALREVSPYLDIGWRIAAGLAVCIGAGYLLDRWWGTLPWLTLAGAILGMVSVFMLIRQIGEQLDQPPGATSSRRAGSSGKEATDEAAPDDTS